MGVGMTDSGSRSWASPTGMMGVAVATGARRGWWGRVGAWCLLVSGARRGVPGAPVLLHMTA